MGFDLISVLDEKTALLTPKEVSNIFRTSLNSVQRMAARRELPHFVIDGRNRFGPAELIRWIVKKNPAIMNGRSSDSAKYRS